MTQKVFTDEMVDNNFQSDEEEDDRLQDWGDWTDSADEDAEDQQTSITCLFCDLKYRSSASLYRHCSSDHSFFFNEIRKGFSLDIYGSFKLINYIRSQVFKNVCWSCGSSFSSRQDMQDHLHGIADYENCTTPWEDDKYLTPFVRDDPLLYMFSEEDEEIEDGDNNIINNNELSNDIKSSVIDFADNGMAHVSLLDGRSTDDNHLEKMKEIDNIYGNGSFGSYDMNKTGETMSSSDAAAKQISHTNESYFGSYSSFGIHREMIKDEVRMGAYKAALLNNPSLMQGAVVVDVGCGTGILSLFAAKAGASRVLAIEASAKMAAVANQIAIDNDVVWDEVAKKGVITVIEGMIEEVGGSVEPRSVDVIVSEWMGYCLMYETMLSSVIFARDRWLKPGGAILPDTATIFAAGFGRGGTSVPFWENVYGFNMSSIGREEVESSARIPIIDFVDPSDIVTNTAFVQGFDLVKMRRGEMDFTACVELEPAGAVLGCDAPCWCCHGVVLWFETGFTDRFCKEKQVILSTSPHGPKTHWAQTLLTFTEPISVPAMSKLHLRISIARDAGQHRCIDISMETAVVGDDGWKRSWPAQLFNLC